MLDMLHILSALLSKKSDFNKKKEFGENHGGYTLYTGVSARYKWNRLAYKKVVGLINFVFHIYLK